MTKIVSAINKENATKEALSQLTKSNTVAIPTETVYGLAADATNGIAIAKIFQQKNRPSFNPLICHVDGIKMAMQFGKINDVTKKLINTFWPGPLTLVVPLLENSKAHDLVTAGLGTIGLRCPNGFSREIIEKFGKPLAAPSANRSGRISPTSASHVATEFEHLDLLIIDDGPCSVGLESTILKVDGEVLTLLRSGGISKQHIEEIAGISVLFPEENSAVANKILAPGMMVSHYAPNADVKLNCDTCDDNAAWLGFGEQTVKTTHSLNLSETGDLVEAGSNLYAYMKVLDKTGCETICVAPIPMRDLGIAINDRLSRAAAPKNVQ
ncbi:MAG: threonylcarbamoyl-AMP synthase [Hyphomicrobiales bacterium]|nr:threonylcarbamoyl-AMP synthase [Hyphomicrobiales bacterium]PCH50216.1 MAG: threonylcarbamoyl-AMP synthase [Hyphomicrobiales bacterium]